MKTWKKCAAGLLALASWTSGLSAQVPGVPAAPAVAAPAVAGAPAPGGLWTFLGLSKPQLAACKEKICQMQIGILMSNSLAPVRAFSGGIMPECCPVATAADLAKPADSAEGAAARIKADEAGAKARRAAARYLGTVDCHYWPEAEAGLINALRTDKNECVRMEAAWALGSGCCCTKKTVEALSITVSGSDRDGNAAERSARVIEAARFALARCVACFNSRCAMGEDQLPPPKEQAPKEGANTAEKKPDNRPYYEKISTTPANEIYEKARQLLEIGFEGEGPTADISDRSVFGVVQAAFHRATKRSPEQPTPTMTAAAMTAPKPHPLENTMALAMNQPQAPVSTYAARPTMAPAQPAPRGLLAVVRQNLTHQPHAQEVEKTPLPQAAVVSVQRPVDRAAQPAPATAYRTITYHKPAVKAEADVQQVSHQLPAGTFLPDLLKTLQHGSVQQREWAAQCLQGIDGRAHPEAVQTLAVVCRNDASAEVRAACVRCLAQIDVSTPEVIQALTVLQGDGNGDVRVEAHRALAKLER